MGHWISVPTCTVLGMPAGDPHLVRLIYDLPLSSSTLGYIWDHWLSSWKPFLIPHVAYWFFSSPASLIIPSETPSGSSFASRPPNVGRLQGSAPTLVFPSVLSHDGSLSPKLGALPVSWWVTLRASYLSDISSWWINTNLKLITAKVGLLLFCPKFAPSPPLNLAHHHLMALSLTQCFG